MVAASEVATVVDSEVVTGEGGVEGVAASPPEAAVASHLEVGEDLQDFEGEVEVVEEEEVRLSCNVIQFC